MSQAFGENFLNSVDLLIAKARSKPSAEAIAIWEEVLTISPTNSVALYSITECLASSGQYKRAIEFLSRLKVQSDELGKALEKRFVLGSYAMSDLAERLRIEGDLNGAIVKFNESLLLDSNNSDAFVGLGRISLEKGDLQAAASYLSSAIDIDPENAYAYIAMGDLLLTQSPERAVDLYKKAIQLNPHEEYTFEQLATANKALSKEGRKRL